jgi:hypothetical protein
MKWLEVENAFLLRSKLRIGQKTIPLRHAAKNGMKGFFKIIAMVT